MTVEQEVDALTTAVDNLKAAVVTKKATLDASVVDAQSATSQAQSAKTAALSARDQANASKNAALGYAASAASAVAYQDLTALAESKAVTAVDVFIYDTSKDSDGGAWRHRCSGTSWYNETLNTATRGSRREFPAVAVIVAEASKVTIYDGDDPALPMWMVFNGGSGGFLYTGAIAVTMLNGLLVSGNNLSVSQADLIKDEYFFRNINGAKWNTENLLNRNKTGGPYATGSIPAIVNSTVNDVAMTVLPDAPTDPATGLPVPTIAVATDGGVSVIKDDGTVVDSGASSAILIATTDEGVWWTPEFANQMYFATWTDVYAGDGFGDFVGSITAGLAFIDMLTRARSAIISTGDLLALGSNVEDGLMLHQPNHTDQSKGMSALTTSTYNTGWMNGDIKGAFLSSTDTASLVGSGELVPNGTFDTDTSGWSATTGSLAVVSGELELTSDGTEQYGYASATAVPVVVGKTYVFSATYRSGTANGARLTLAGATSRNVGSDNATTVAKTLTLSFVAQSTQLYIQGLVYSADGTSRTGYFDNVSVKLADADRSVNNKGLVVSGSITRSPVATGAELVAYSGFSASNYLEQPYNPDLDFGTGDFCVMGWVELNSTGWGGIFHLSAEKTSTSNPGFCLFYLPTGVCLKVGNQTAQSTVRPSEKTHVCGVRSGTTLLLYLNGALVGAYPNATNSATPSSGASLLVGGYYQTGAPVVASPNDKFALLRISATAPTADQIAKIYEDEKVLFQENAQATLYGASDAVTALAHDPDTGLLHVGTSAGRSVFKGLRRVSNTTTAVGKAISAVNGMVVEE